MFWSCHLGQRRRRGLCVCISVWWLAGVVAVSLCFGPANVDAVGVVVRIDGRVDWFDEAVDKECFERLEEGVVVERPVVEEAVEARNEWLPERGEEYGACEEGDEDCADCLQCHWRR